LERVKLGRTPIADIAHAVPIRVVLIGVVVTRTDITRVSNPVGAFSAAVPFPQQLGSNGVVLKEVPGHL
jgi:hypothetical protein